MIILGFLRSSEVSDVGIIHQHFLGVYVLQTPHLAVETAALIQFIIWVASIDLDATLIRGRIKRFLERSGPREDDLFEHRPVNLLSC